LIAEKPEEYRWNSIGYHVQTDNKDDFLSLDFGLKEFNVLGSKERLRRYRRFPYEKGAKQTEKGVQIDEKTLAKERGRDFKLSKVNRFAYRTRYFPDSGIIGTKEFVAQN
jgi:putative transposase